MKKYKIAATLFLILFIISGIISVMLLIKADNLNSAEELKWTIISIGLALVSIVSLVATSLFTDKYRGNINKDEQI